VHQRGRRAPSRIEGARLRYLALVGALAATFTVADYLRYVGLDIPPVGTVLTLIFLYVLSQSILRFRLLDLYELAGRLGVLTALSFSLAFILLRRRAGLGRRLLPALRGGGHGDAAPLRPGARKVENKISRSSSSASASTSSRRPPTIRRRIARVPSKWTTSPASSSTAWSNRAA
jgi:hypothetical protein